MRVNKLKEGCICRCGIATILLIHLYKLNSCQDKKKKGARGGTILPLYDVMQSAIVSSIRCIRMYSVELDTTEYSEVNKTEQRGDVNPILARGGQICPTKPENLNYGQKYD